MKSIELKEKYIITKEGNFLPRGMFAWKSISEAIVSKLGKYGFEEYYLFNNEYSLDNKVQMNNYIKDETLNHISISSYSSLIEGARTSSIDILQTYVSLSKQVLALNMLTGKCVTFDGSEDYLLGVYTKDNRFIKVGSTSLKEKDGRYNVTTSYSSKCIDALSEVNYDDKGMIFSSSLYQIGIVPLKIKESNVLGYVRKLKLTLENKGYSVYLNEDKTNEKEKLDSCLEMGIPLIIEVGPRDILNSTLEVIKRTENNILNVKEEKLLSYINNFFKKVNSDLINEQVKHIINNSVNVNSKEELIASFNEGKIVNYVWDGKEDTYNLIKKECDNSVIFIPFNQELFVEKDIISNREGKYIISICKSR